MLEGLEATEVRFSTLLTGVETFRLDSEYYRREYIEIENYIKSQPNLFCKFSDLGVTVDCSAFYAGIEPLYGSGNIPLIRVQNVKYSIDYDNCVTLPFLTEPQYSTLKIVEEGDIVITKGGSIGFVGYVTKRAYASRDLIFLKTSSLSESHRIFLYLYLSSPFAFKQLIRSSSQCAQPHLTITLVKDFDILKAQELLIEGCSQLYKKHREALYLSQALYSSAENYLLECLGMQDFAANPDAYNVKSLKESFLESGRIDAEYYLPKYEDLMLFIQNYSMGSLPLSDIADFYRGALISDTYYTDYDATRPAYIRGGDISSNRMVSDNMVSVSSDFIPSEETICIEGDIVMAMIGSVGTASIVTQDFAGSYISNNLGLLRLCNTSIRAEVLHLYLTSTIGKMFFTQRQMVTAQPKIAFRDIESIPIPLIRPEVQEEIAQHVQRSFTLRKEASQLLEKAKLSVERAIEMGVTS